MVEALAVFAYLVVGVVAGLLAGLLGISGGIVTVPSLLLVFHFLHLPQGDLMHFAIGTSLASMVFSALSATWFHHRRKGVLWELVRSMAPGILIGCFLGSFLAKILSEVFLEIIFGIFACLTGLYFWGQVKLAPTPHPLPNRWILNSLGAGIGALSNLLGIGGGIITVPILMGFHVPERRAIASSAATGLIISLFGALSYLYFGLGEVECKGCIGYVYIPAFIMISLSTLVAAPFGVALSHILSPPLLKRLFAVVLFCTGLLMLIG